MRRSTMILLKLLLTSQLVFIIVAITCIAVLLSACATDPLVVDRAPVQVQRYDPPPPVPVRPADIEFKVLTYEVTKEMNVEVEEGEAPMYSFMAMSTEDYLSYAAWLQELKRYIQQLQATVDFYRNPPVPEPPE